MDTKAAFEREAFAQENGMTMEFVNWFFDEKAAGCGQVWFMMAAAMWEGWTASRAAIEIDLPGQENYDDPLSAHLAIKDCAEVITSHGIRIKGKTE